MLASSFWPALCAFGGVMLGTLVLIDFGIYIAARYRERFLEEARTELDDVLIQLPPGRLLDLCLAVAAVGGILTIVFIGSCVENFSWGWGILIALIVAALCFPLPRFGLRYLRKRRLHKFNLQLEDALSMISSALKAGFSINQALEEVSEQKIHPIAVEFRLLMQEIRLGVPLDQALENMARRVESDDFELVATAITTARQTGGELTETLERVAALIRERVRIANKVKALTSMGRLQAVMIGAMPYFLMFGLYQVSPEMMRQFFHSVVGIVAVIVVTILVILGFLSIRKITTIEV